MSKGRQYAPKALSRPVLSLPLSKGQFRCGYCNNGVEPRALDTSSGDRCLTCGARFSVMPAAKKGDFKRRTGLTVSELRVVGR